MHGFDQSQEVTRTARLHSAALEAQRQGLPGADELVARTSADLAEARANYCDPFRHRTDR